MLADRVIHHFYPQYHRIDDLSGTPPRLAFHYMHELREHYLSVHRAAVADVRAPGVYAPAADE